MTSNALIVFIAVCVAIMTVELSFLLAFLIITLRKIKQGAQAVEVLAYRVEEEVEAFTSRMRSGWFKALEGTARILMSAFWPSKKKEE
ncbi:MAG: hypothetical protein HY921_03815 [Elusimicrobia bacterium]|nr:hypothetical protein [Elusimicrobiota bacterium]